MININENEFEELKSKGEIFSVISSFRGDDLTPINIYKGMDGEKKFIFESGSRNEHFGRYSFIGTRPNKIYKGDSLHELKVMEKELEMGFNDKTNPFSFKGGVIGYLSYDIIEEYEERLKFRNKEDFFIENFKFFLYKEYITYDAFTHRIHIVKNVYPEDRLNYKEIIDSQRAYFKGIKKVISRDLTVIDDDFKRHEIEETNSISKEGFIKSVKRAKEYIEEGDIFQVVLSLRKYVKTKKSALELYRRLREENPSPYMFLIEDTNLSIIGASPESLVSVKEGIVRTNPIAGTRKRGKTLEEDIALERDLLDDKKEIAEHVMLVDLGRNDIGKISRFGTVTVDEFMKVEKFSHVMHITSRVRGELEEGKNAFDALEACLPAGTVSGAPKIRAMEIIEELENKKRGLYAGAVGYFSYGGNMDMSIAIRTIVLKDSIASIQAGAGIVFDSVPEKEYEEVENKLGILKAVLR